jgi:multidrug efflux pump subunit AcrA (membrane-fusion protein)
MSNKTTLRKAFLGIVVAAIASMAGCAEIESVTAEPYEPAHLESTSPDQPKRVILTEEAVQRTELKTTRVRLEDGDLEVEHAALVYDQKGKPWVFTVVGPRTYVRAPVEIEEIDDELMILATGPRPGTEVVTVGAIELWGAELEVAGKH